MYRIIVTEDFLDVVKAVPLRHINTLLHSFKSIERLDGNEALEVEQRDNTFLTDLLEQMKYQELE